MREAASQQVSESASQHGLRILIAGGGTGGHVIPALAIGRELRDRHGADVRYVGTARGIETRLLPEAGFPLELIRVGQLKNVSLATRLKTLTDLPRGIALCLRLIREFSPSLVIGVGGYASGPAMMAALLCGVPTLAYEPNAAPGLANRLVGRFVSAAAINFPQAEKHFRNATLTGVPVREEIAAIAPYTVDQPPRLLVTAGSQGARVFNETLPQIATSLLAKIPGLTIVHQTGERALDETVERYRRHNVDVSRVDVRSFLRDMPQQLLAATLVLSRSGSTVAELAAAGRASLLVPFPQAADDHQTRNAEALVGIGAAEILPQRDLTPERLEGAILDLMLRPETLRSMAEKARSAARPRALQAIVGMAVELATACE